MNSSSSNSDTQQLDQANSYTVSTFFSSLIVSFAIFGGEVLAFLLLNGGNPRIYRPRTYLVPERARVKAPPTGLWGWAIPTFKTSNSEFIQKCGLDAYFFLRYLRLLLRLFVPIAIVVLPILLPLNAFGGRGGNFATGIYKNDPTSWADVKGLNQLSWSNVRPTHNGRYWAHLVLAICVIVYCCYVFFDELRGFIRLRQAYLTSPQHRLRASATTVLVSAIPRKWCTAEALDGLYDVFPGGIRNIWINRNFDELNDKVKERNEFAKKLESAQTALIKKANEEHMKQTEKEAKKAGNKVSGQEQVAERKRRDDLGYAMSHSQGTSSGNPHQVKHTVDEAISNSGSGSSRDSSPIREKKNAAAKGAASSQNQRGLHNHDSSSKKSHLKSRLANFGSRGQGYGLSPTPHTREEDEFPLSTESPAIGGANPGAVVNGVGSDTPHAEKKSKLAFLKVWGGDEAVESVQYPTAFNQSYNPREDGEPLWSKYVKADDRDTMRLPIFGKSWLGWIPFVGKKIDTIDYCRRELARLNTEIERDQKDPDRYPLLNSAFIQFNHQVAAHMACQAVSHHVPVQMAPRAVEISPGDVLWDNLSVTWWEQYIRTGVVLVLIAALVIFWSFPVAFTGLLSNLDGLAAAYPWLSGVKKLPQVLISVIQGVGPATLLAILLAVLPMILRFLAKSQGVTTGMAAELAVQNFYFAFLFVQVFLVLTLASGASNVLAQLGKNLKNPGSIPELLASALPKASNYFFSYLLLQALSTSAGTLLQIVAVAVRFLLAPILDSTARQKWSRQVTLPNVQWGTFFPVFTNLAVIGLVYSVIAPLILIFNIITFSLFWFVYRYNTLYVTQFRFDTGGMLFPTAVNQLFTGLYVMELCMVGLFFLVRDVNLETGQSEGVPCYKQAIIMIVVLIITVIFQYLLNMAFSPLFRYLPITLEDDAVLRDEEFARAQHARFNQASPEDEDEDINDALESRERHSREQDRATESIEMQGIEKRRDQPSSGKPGSNTLGAFDPRKLVNTMTDGMTDTLSKIAPGRISWLNERQQRRHGVDVNNRKSAHLTHQDSGEQHPKAARGLRLPADLHLPADMHLPFPSDAEARGDGTNRVGDALFGGLHDEIEDLTPEERDLLVQRAFQHEALRARRPCIWVPRDELGVSDDEVRRTAEFSANIWISNDYAGLDGRNKVVFGKGAPDFTQVDLIEL